MTKKTKMTILVSGASGILGYGILKSLRLANSAYRLIGTTIYNASVAPAFSDVVEIAPKTSDKAYMPWLLSVVKRHNVDMIIPGLECDMIRWNEEKHLIQEAGALALLNSGALIKLCCDKWKFYQELNRLHPNYAIPTYLAPDYHSIPAPFLLKPRSGYGSKGIVTVTSSAEFRRHQKRIGPDLMMQQIVGSPAEEYTMSAFFSHNAEVLECVALRRVLSPNGYTQEAEVVDAQQFQTFLQHMASAFNPVGPTNFQFRLVHGEIKLLEINPRISAATSIRALLGFNEAGTSVEYFMNGQVPQKIEQSRIVGRKAIRYVEDFLL